MDTLSGNTHAAVGYGVVTWPLIAAREDPQHRAQLLTQLLFGERYEVLHSEGEWLLIRTSEEAYTCWIPALQHHSISQRYYNELSTRVQQRCGDHSAVLTSPEGKRMLVPCASLFAGYSQGQFELAGVTYSFEGRIARHDAESRIRHARRFLNAPYLWGGKSIMGIDCSALLQIAFQCAGFSLPRDAWQQEQCGRAVNHLEEAQAQDLCFFANDSGKITHVAMYLGQHQVIHASGWVKVEAITPEGIWNEAGHLTHQLSSIKRIAAH